MKRGWLLAAAHVSIVLALGGKPLYDRSTLPKVWTRAAPVDPNLPIRGRYVSLLLEVVPKGFPSTSGVQHCRLSVSNNALQCEADGAAKSQMRLEPVPTLLAPVAFFIPEHVADPSIRKLGEELWVEVTVPPYGPPRPIRLGVKRHVGPIEPM